MRYLLSLILLCLFLPSPAQTPLFDESDGPATRAVIFGVSKYHDSRITPLQYADKDAEAFAAFLQSAAGGSVPPDNVHVVTNEQATCAKFFQEMGWLREKSQEGDRAIIFFSGHGDVETDADGMGFLLTHDCPFNNYLGPWSIELTQLEAAITRLENKKVEVLMITDACRSGNLSGNNLGGRGLTAQALARSFQSTTKVLSCQPNELSLEGQQWGGGHAAFTYHLIQGLIGLADQNKDAKVTLWEIDQYLSSTVTRDVAPKSQTPFTDGDRTKVLALVDKKMLRDLQKKKAEELPAFSTVETKGFEQAVVDQAGQEAKTAYAGFNRTLEAQQLLDPAGDCTETYFNQLVGIAAIEPIHETVTRNYAAALWDASIDAFHVYIKSDSVRLAEMFKSDSNFSKYPLYLKRAAELLDSTHYMHNTLMGAYNYFNGKVKTVEYYETGRPASVLEEAMESQEKSLEYLEIASSYYELAIANYENKQFGKAEEFFRKAIEKSPTWSQPYDGLGALYRDKGDYAQARDMYATALELSPEELKGPAHRNLGYVYHKLDDYEKAEIHLKEALNYRPKDHFIHYFLGSVYRDMERFDDAENAFLRTIQLNPKFAAAFYYLGLVFQDQKRYADAEAVLETAVNEESRNASFRYHLAINHYYQQRYETALKMLREVLDMAPGFTDAYYYLANSLKALGRNDEAEEVLLQAAEKAPADAEYLFQLGLVRFEAQDAAGADSLFRQALQLDPEHPYACFYLGMSLLQLGKKADAALQFEKAAALVPEKADIHYQLGLTYYELKSYTQAEAPLQKAIEIAPGFGLAYYTLGMVYNKTGRPDEAGQMLDKAKELGVE